MEEIIFTPVKSKTKIDVKKVLEFSKKLPKNIAIAYSIQFENQAKEVKNILKKNHNIEKIVQVLGCSMIEISKKTKAVLLVGSGKFHAVSLAYKINLPVYVLDNNKINLISKKDLEIFGKKEKYAYARFLNSNNVGVLISMKSGQNNLKRARELEKKYKQKSFYFFISDEVNLSETENFPDIDFWINTACPRMDMSFNNRSDILNFSDVEGFG